MKTRRSAKLLAAVTAASLVVAACGGDDDDSADTPSPTSGTDAPAPTDGGDDTPDTTDEGDDTPDTTDDGGDDTPDTTTGGGDTPDGAAMVLTVNLNPDAVWEDGTPITVADLECTYLANLNTPGSLQVAGYDQIISVEAGDSDKQAIITFSSVYAPFRGLFNPILKADMHDDCTDVSLDFEGVTPPSGRAFKFEEWSETQSVLVPNENYWGEPPLADRIVMVPLEDQDTEKAALDAGDVDMISPQFDPSFQALVDGNSNVSLDIGFGGDYEGLYFQMSDDPALAGPFADPVYREAFYKSIDRAALFEQIYRPIGGETAVALTCGPIVPGPYCPDGNGPFVDMYDPDGAAALLEENGWTKGADGFWVSPDGEVPTVRWIVNTGNTRRENTQAYLIPLLEQAGFKVVPDNCDADCYFQQRLPAMDFDLAMYISTAPPDPSYLIPNLTCDNIPTEANNYVGQNTTGWCDEEASQMLLESDVTVDADARAQLIRDALALFAEDYGMLPLFQFPKAHLARTDKIGPAEAVARDVTNYMEFARTLPFFEDVDGDGQIVIGAEQWPGCLNPVTECANSSWYVWTVSFAVMPGIWDTTSSGEYVITDLVTEEPVVEVL